jgi:hypothetical protein
MLYWNGMKLTRGVGFFTSFGLKDGQLHQSSLGGWDFDKIDDTKFLLRIKYGILPVQEIWRIEVIDEKQIGWDVQIHAEKDIAISEGKVAIISSEKYRKWVDDWGEGYFPPLNDHRKVELRNPNSKFIGLRGRKKLKGQLPTILFDLSKNNADFYPFVKNAVSPLGARLLGVELGDSDGKGRYVSGKCLLFSGIIKIVEEDFKKRSLQRKK